MSNENEYRMSHQARVRDRKRLTYQKFLRWVNDPANRIPENETVPKAQLRKEWLERAFATFPGFKERFDSAIEKMAKIRQANEKFNGNLVRELTGLEGKELGEFMRTFIGEFIGKQGKTRTEWALEHAQLEINNAILEWLKR